MKEKAEMSTARSFCSSIYKNMSRHSPCYRLLHRGSELMKQFFL